MTFSMKTLFGVMSAAAVALFLLVAAPAVVASPLLVLMHVVWASVLLACIVYGAGRLRAFAIGAMIPAGATIVALTYLLTVWLIGGAYETRQLDRLLEFLRNWAFTIRVWSGASWVLCPLTGLAVVCVRYLLYVPPRDD